MNSVLTYLTLLFSALFFQSQAQNTTEVSTTQLDHDKGIVRVSLSPAETCNTFNDSPTQFGSLLLEDGRLEVRCREIKKLDISL